MAPTVMKTVPSGRLDFFMKGASLVSGTTSVGMGNNVPASVGKSLRPGNAALLLVVDIDDVSVVDVEVNVEDVDVVAAGSAAKAVIARMRAVTKRLSHGLRSNPTVDCVILDETPWCVQHLLVCLYNLLIPSSVRLARNLSFQPPLWRCPPFAPAECVLTNINGEFEFDVNRLFSAVYGLGDSPEGVACGGMLRR